MKKKIWSIISGSTLVLACLSSFSANAQCSVPTWNANSPNMVVNGSFEMLNPCPTTFNSIGDITSNNSSACSWFAPATGVTPDHYSSCSNGSVNVPNAFFGYQDAHNNPGATPGSAYIGMFTYSTQAFSDPNSDPREYIVQTLPSGRNLKHNRDYYSEFFTSAAEGSGYFINNMGMYFSSSLPTFVAPRQYQVTPQVHNNGTLLNDSFGWSKISGTFKASGGEKYITIGRFAYNSANLNSDAAPNPTTSGTFPTHSYYYIDDVALYEIPYAGKDTSICSNTTIQLGNGLSLPNYLGATYSWTSTHPGFTNPGTYTFNYSPTQTATYTLTVSIPGQAPSVSSVTVTVNQTPVFFTYGSGTICEGQSVQIGAFSEEGYYWSWSHGGEINMFPGEGTGLVVSPTTTTTYQVTASNGKCSATQEITVYVVPKVNAGNDVTICPGASVQLQATGISKLTSVSWSPSTGLNDPNSQSPIANPATTTTYTVTATRNGCTSTDQVTVTVNNSAGYVGFYQSLSSGSYDPITGTYAFDTGLAEGDAGTNTFCFDVNEVTGISTLARLYLTNNGANTNGVGTWTLGAKSRYASYSTYTQWNNNILYNMLRVNFRFVSDFIELEFSYPTDCGTQTRSFTFNARDCNNNSFSVNQVQESNLTSVYPNPALGSFTIESKTGATYRLFNNQGTEVKGGTLARGKATINTEKLKKGLYYLHIQNGKEIEKQQIIIE